jgi:hypothetical protein
MLADPPPNVRPNWPSDNVSLYEIAEETDLILSAWSNVGKEMCLFGIPVLVYSEEALWYPADLNYVGKTREDYFRQLDVALKDGWSFERIRQTYRWYVHEFCTSQVDISDSNRYRPYLPPRNFAERVARKLKKTLLPGIDARLDCMRRSARLKAQKSIAELFAKGEETPLALPGFGGDRHVSLDEETQALKSELKRLAEAMYGKRPASSRPNTLQEKLMRVL